MDKYFVSIFDTTATVSISLSSFFICMLAGLVLGLVMAFIYHLGNKSSQSFLGTLAMLPMIVAMVIMMVNGNIGAGVAVAGAFSLVRFRSVPGTAKEIAAIFTAMCTGLTIGMGYIAFAALFTLIACIFSLIINSSSFGKETIELRSLQITIPENLNYTNVFDDIFEEYTETAKLVSAKTSNMGSMFKLSYELSFKENKNEKAFMDELRCRNGNLEIMLTIRPSQDNGL